MLNNSKLGRLKKIIHDYQKVIVAFSGGVDSSFLLKICVGVLSPENTIAATAVSDSYTMDELKYAKSISKMFKVEHIVLKTDEMSDRNFINNTPHRCYHCKKHLFSRLKKIAGIRNIKHVLEASNIDDKSDYRPGRKAAKNFSVRSPLIEAKLTKDDIRKYSKAIGLSSWNKPSNPCLASRIPYGKRITKEKLKMIERAEAFLKKEGLKIVRVRHHGDIARIEVSGGNFKKLTKKNTRNKIIEYFRKLGFCWITIDLEGYRTGSLNEVLSQRSIRT